MSRQDIVLENFPNGPIDWRDYLSDIPEVGRHAEDA